MSDFPSDIYTEPKADVHTLDNLGPLTPMAGVWEGQRGLDTKPKADGPRKQAYVEKLEMQPIDPVTNGPQLFYGLRYHIHIVKPEQVKTYHEQVGYWLWEPATSTVIQTLIGSGYRIASKAMETKLKPGSNVVFKVLRGQENGRILTVFLPGVVPAENQQ